MFEVVRLFRDLAIDGPVAMGAWSLGLLLAVVALWLRGGSRALAIIALVSNLLVLLATSAVISSLSGMRMF